MLHTNRRVASITDTSTIAYTGIELSPDVDVIITVVVGVVGVDRLLDVDGMGIRMS